LLSPADVAARAAERGVSHWALTDHDTLAGLDAARVAAEAAGVRLIHGVEISVVWEDVPIHMVGLGVDTHHAGLLAGLENLRGGRLARARRMSDAFAAIGIPNVLAGALKYTETPEQISRAHFARYLVEIGLFKDKGEVFEHYLTPGKPGYVQHQWASLAEAVGWILAAAGVAVVAHPGRYRMSGGQMQRFLENFKALGGAAIEVSCGSHTPDHVRHFAQQARRFGFYASQGSDFHGIETGRPDLGMFAPLPEDLKPVWRLLGY
jgi:predicted metal-dependent phosphoesterase TrpH